MSWRIEYSTRADKDGSRLDGDSRDRIFSAIERLAGTGQGDIRRLKGGKRGEWRLRVGDWRVIYRYVLSTRTIEIIRILPRDKAYRVREPQERYGSGPVESAA